MIAGVDQNLFESRKAVEVGAIERVHLGLRLLEGRTRLEPADVLPVVGVMHFPVGGSERSRCPQANFGVDEVESGGHHAHHLVRFAAQTDVAAQRGLRAPEKPPAEAVAQNGLMIRARLAFGVGKGAAVGRWHAQQPEQGGCRCHAGHALRRSLDLERPAAGAEQGLLREHVDVAQAVVVVAGCAVVAGVRACFRITIRHQQDGARVRHRQRPQQDRVHDSESSGVRGDTNRNGQDHRDGESFVADERANGVAKFAERRSHVDSYDLPALKFRKNPGVELPAGQANNCCARCRRLDTCTPLGHSIVQLRQSPQRTCCTSGASAMKCSSSPRPRNQTRSSFSVRPHAARWAPIAISTCWSSRAGSSIAIG